MIDRRTGGRAQLALGLLGILAATLVGTATTAAPAAADAATHFEWVGPTPPNGGTSFDWTVPAGVTTIRVQVEGAQGGTMNCDTPDSGGLGGKTTATLTVTPGELLKVFPGGEGVGVGVGTPYGCNDADLQPAGGFNGGGSAGTQQGNVFSGAGGGGASDIRRAPYDLNARLVVAGGGGGAASTRTFTGRTGGGDGGGPSGSPGVEANGQGGLGGTPTGPGAGGANGGGGFPGIAGAFGVGGNGGSPNGAPAAEAAGGGGGGGWYGGGGGGAGALTGGGGGGGSGHGPDGAVLVGGAHAGPGRVVIDILAPQVITFTSTATNPTVGSTYTPTATGGGSNNPVVFSIASGPCTIANGVVTFTGTGSCVVAANQAGNADYTAAPQVTQTITVVKASPTISTQASPGTLVGGPARDVATLAGGSSPTGTVTFRLFTSSSCATQVFTSSNAVSSTTAASDWYTPATTGAYYWTAVYNGDGANNSATSACNASNESVTIAPFTPPPPTRTITADLSGPVTVGAGESVLITGARVMGPVTVAPGGALSLVNAQIARGLVADAPAFLSICGTQLAGYPGQALNVTNAAVPIRIGDPANGCAGNKVAGTVSFSSDVAVTFGANAVSHATTFTGNGPGATVVKANTFYGALACTGSTPAPTNLGQGNTAPSKTGQCSGL